VNVSAWSGLCLDGRHQSSQVNDVDVLKGTSEFIKLRMYRP